MTAALKAKGPEALERLPSRVQTNPAKGKAMNVATNTTAARAAPVVPHPAQTPYLDLHGAMALLRILHDRLLEGPLCAEESANFSFLISQAFHLMEPVRDYLDSIEDSEGQQEIYLDARRDWILLKQGGAS